VSTKIHHVASSVLADVDFAVGVGDFENAFHNLKPFVFRLFYFDLSLALTKAIFNNLGYLNVIITCDRELVLV
jgi:hypothetical protein